MIHSNHLEFLKGCYFLVILKVMVSKGSLNLMIK